MKRKLVNLLALCVVLSSLFAGTAVFAETEESADTDKKDSSETEEKPTSPATGDQAMTIFWMGLAMAAAGLFAQMKRRNS